MNAKRDENRIPTLIGVSSSDGITPVLVYVDPTTHRLLVDLTNSVPTTITVANEATDTTCFPLFVTAATGDLGPKTNAGLSFDSSTGILTLAGLALGAGSLTMTGSIGVTGGRVTKGWFTNLEITNLPTINGGTLATALSLGTMASETATNYVAKSLFDANTILYATADNTPLALTIGASTIVGRKATGDIVALTGAEALTISGGESTSNKKTTLSDDSDTYYPSQKAVKTAVDAKLASADKATSAEINTGTEDNKYITPDQLAGSKAFTKTVQQICVGFATELAVADGVGYIVIPAECNGMNLISARADVITPGTTNASTFDIYNVTDSTSMLSSAISIASGAKSGTGTVDTDHDDVVTGDIIRIDVDTLSTTKPKGLIVTLAFRLP
jgi:hypothetical protein